MLFVFFRLGCLWVGAWGEEVRQETAEKLCEFHSSLLLREDDGDIISSGTDWFRSAGGRKEGSFRKGLSVHVLYRIGTAATTRDLHALGSLYPSFRASFFLGAGKSGRRTTLEEGRTG